MNAVLVSLLLFAELSSADKEINAAGVSVRVKGQSGKMTIAMPSADGSTQVDCQMVALRQLDGAGNVLGGGGAEKHSFNSFATQSFTFSEPMDDTYQGLEVAKVAFNSILVGSSEVRIDTFIFKEPGTLRVGDEELNVTAGAVKFNVALGTWSWCGRDADCKGNSGVGDFVEVDLSISAASEEDNRRLTPLRMEGGDYGLAPGASLTMLTTYSSDGGDTWTSMPEGYPKAMGDTFTLRFPRWSGAVIYDPIIQSTAEATDSDADTGVISSTTGLPTDPDATGTESSSTTDSTTDPDPTATSLPDTTGSESSSTSDSPADPDSTDSHNSSTTESSVSDPDSTTTTTSTTTGLVTDPMSSADSVCARLFGLVLYCAAMLL